MVDDKGNLKRMLSYPNLGNGKDKVLEMIQKGKDFDIDSNVVLGRKRNNIQEVVYTRPNIGSEEDRASGGEEEQRSCIAR